MTKKTLIADLPEFDIADHLQTTEDIRLFLKEVADTGNESDFIHVSETGMVPGKKPVLFDKIAREG